MLIAEIHGKVVEEAESDEDYMTSAVFGHLRYVAPGVFWSQLFERALGVQEGRSLADALRANGVDLTNYSGLATHFWPKHPEFGEPDLILHFSGQGVPSLFVLIEVKLWGGKSGWGNNDQLARYIRLLDDLQSVDGFSVGHGDHRLLVYLTPRDTTAELQESLNTMAEQGGCPNRMFRLQWQDVLEAAQRAKESLPCDTVAGTPNWTRAILTDVAEFLERRNLAYFRGFERSRALDDIAVAEPLFCDAISTASDSSWQGMSENCDLGVFPIELGRWMQ